MVQITLSFPLALLLAGGGAAWIYRDARRRSMETGDMYAVGFFVGMFLPPIVGAVVVGLLYLRNREPRRPQYVGVPE